ncbi:MAG: TonB-dependent receptor [Rhodocyclaceae bacterium]|nr:TonB-dependent receptor [Rhodocyclaceae bacterium]MBL0076273.1 TonB-dependent receptor [Rhodocyclaceae bacterium]
MKFKKTQMAVAVVGALSIVSSALAQTAAPERVTVTGSNIKRVSVEGSQPIEVITAKDIQQSGAKTVLELMKTVTALGADGQNDNSGQNSFSSGVATASLRSLGATSTLILINGRRMTPSAYANPNLGASTIYDLNTIPLSAIDRVEILKDGASAVYGSDAVGGVINFITKTDYQGFEVNTRMGFNDDGEFARRAVTISAGFGDLNSNGWNFLVSGDFSQRDSTMMADGSNDIQADQYNQINLRGNPFSSSLSAYPVFYKENGTNNAAANGTRSFPTATPTTVVSIVTAGCPADRLLTVTPGATGTGVVYGIAATSALTGKSFCNFNNDLYTEMQSKGDDAAFMAHGTLRLGSSMTAFTELAYSKSDRTYILPARTIDGLAPVTNFLVGGVGASFQAILPIGHPDNPFNADATPRAAAVRYRFENHPGGTDLTNEQYRVLLGIKGTIGTWDWEAAYLWNRTEREETRHGFLYLPVLRQLLTGRTLASIANDPAISPDITALAFAEIKQYDFKATTEFGSLGGGPIGFATGMEFRNEAIGVSADPKHANGDIMGFATTQIFGDRDVKSAFFEFRTPWMRTFETDFAGRFDKYPGIATSFVPKVGFKWTVMDNFVVRGSYAEGFRAPAVSQVSPGGAQSFLNGLHDPLRCEQDGTTPKPNGGTALDCAKSVSSVGVANPALKPEDSKSWTFGMIYSPTSNIDMLVDVFDIIKKGEVARGAAQDILDHPNNYPPGSITRETSPVLLLTDALGNPIPGTGPLISVARPWVNQGSTEIHGFDLEIRMRNSLGEYGKLSSSLKGTYLLRYLREEQPGLPTWNAVGTSGGLADWATSSDTIPRLKLRIASALEVGGHTFTGAVNYVSSISQIRRFDGFGGTNGTTYTYNGSTCHWGGAAEANLGGRSVLGVAATATNGRNTYIAYHPDCTVPAWATYDLGYQYKGIKNLTLGIQVSNILDTKAPYTPTTDATTIAEGYDPGLHDNRGRYFLLSAGYKFK